MITNNTLQFLKKLSKNNNKEWFNENKVSYQNAQAEIVDFIAAWIHQFGKKEESILNLDPKKCVFRIHRDVRFSANKNPYKTNLGAYLTKGKHTNLAGYYLHIEPGKCFFGAGNYMPMPDQLAKIRQEIDYNLADFNKIISNKKFKENFGELSQENKLIRPPKGYDENNKAIDFLKLKGFTVYKSISDEELLSNDLLKMVVDLSSTAQPFIHFLDNAVE